jgi:hypothetical protein
MNHSLFRTFSWINVLVLALILGSCGGDTRQDAASLPVPTYPAAVKIRVDLDVPPLPSPLIMGLLNTVADSMPVG